MKTVCLIDLITICWSIRSCSSNQCLGYNLNRYLARRVLRLHNLLLSLLGSIGRYYFVRAIFKYTYADDIIIYSEYVIIN